MVFGHEYDFSPNDKFSVMYHLVPNYSDSYFSCNAFFYLLILNRWTYLLIQIQIRLLIGCHEMNFDFIFSVFQIDGTQKSFTILGLPQDDAAWPKTHRLAFLGNIVEH